jgi:glycosyltransferase involved in cell wall biosynthesis
LRAARPLRVAILNEVWPDGATTVQELFARMPTLTGWADALAARGASVGIFQRFSRDQEAAHRSVHCLLRADSASSRPPATFGGNASLRGAIAAWEPDVVHVNGFDYPRAIRRLRRQVGATRIVAQDHGGFEPRVLHPIRRAWMRRGLRAVDAVLVSTPPQRELFRASGLVPGRVRIFDVMEGSTTLRVEARRPAAGRPALLWVGRLNENKDPLTVVAGFARFLADQPDATLTFVYQDETLGPQLRRAIAADARLQRTVTLLGAMAQEQLHNLYAAADFFVLGSHHESTGYAVLEALACGVPPVVTDIPSFRWLTDDGAIGALWRPGDAAGFHAALELAASRDIHSQRDACRQRFDAHFSWNAIGQRALEIYEELSPT